VIRSQKGKNWRNCFLLGKKTVRFKRGQGPSFPPGGQNGKKAPADRPERRDLRTRPYRKRIGRDDGIPNGASQKPFWGQFNCSFGLAHSNAVRRGPNKLGGPEEPPSIPGLFWMPPCAVGDANVCGRAKIRV